VLSVIDLKTRLLPNRLVGSLAALGIFFHFLSKASLVSVTDIVLGGLTGFGLLYGLRAIANRIYKKDALGLGDVKLMGAGGLWLGPDGILLAMSTGALAGLLHGAVVALIIARKTATRPYFSNLQIPAGPGFSAGLVIAALYVFDNLSFTG
jgi:leader peptidase (prepilin peptidase)/N-methyltransferase